MAKRSHYSFNKRQKELKQKEKAEKKLQRRLAKKAGDDVALDAEGGSTEGDAIEGASAEIDSAAEGAADKRSVEAPGDTPPNGDNEPTARDSG